MSYIPLTDVERHEMLDAIGVSSLDALFDDVPLVHRYPTLPLPAPLSEMEVLSELTAISEQNRDLQHTLSFLGAGAYQHFVPAVVGHITSRSEFYTAYTPYQPEVSQGTLQAIFEYQSLICALTEMEVTNASHYDGATALAEGVLMAYNVLRGKRRKILLSPTIHPEYRAVVRTYVQGIEIEVAGDANLAQAASLAVASALIDQIDDDTFAVAVQNPDFFGGLADPADLRALAEAAHAKRALLIVVGYPIALALIQPPGAYGADIAVGEAQPLGIGLNYGGPYLGYFSCREKHVHKMAGRLVGQTVDVEGQRGYVLTLSAREQHIRRERATSNICTNQSLCALTSAVYLSALGRGGGLRQVAELCYHKAHYLATQIDQLDGYQLARTGPFFNEFVVRCPKPVHEINAHLLHHSIIGGLDLSTFYPGMDDHMLLCATEVHNREMLDRLVRALEKAA